MTDDLARRAIDSYEKDVRFRATAMSVVAEALREHGRVDPERADEEAHRIAMNVAVRLLQRVYEDDAELASLRQERDIYKDHALKLAATTPLMPIVLAGDR